ncbi:hypothetical protein BJV77DRAFT_966626 [Russula vinacea]|nr:hypothetical protein BJV77DRAFT_966626 [Russula vinacea]
MYSLDNRHLALLQHALRLARTPSTHVRIDSYHFSDGTIRINVQYKAYKQVNPCENPNNDDFLSHRQPVLDKFVEYPQLVPDELLDRRQPVLEEVSGYRRLCQTNRHTGNPSHENCLHSHDCPGRIVTILEYPQLVLDELFERRQPLGSVWLQIASARQIDATVGLGKDAVGVGAATLPWVKRLQPVGSRRTKLPPLAERNQLCFSWTTQDEGLRPVEQPTRPNAAVAGPVQPTLLWTKWLPFQCLGNENDRLVLDEALEAAATRQDSNSSWEGVAAASREQLTSNGQSICNQSGAASSPWTK